VIYINGSDWSEYNYTEPETNPLLTGESTNQSDNPLVSWFSETRMIGALIWLSALSLIVIILLVSLIFLSKVQADSGRQPSSISSRTTDDSPPYNMGVYNDDRLTSSTATARSSSYHWFATSGEGKNDTLESKKSKIVDDDDDIDEKTHKDWTNEMKEDTFQNYDNETTSVKYGSVKLSSGSSTLK
jgi:hypothetical protein